MARKDKDEKAKAAKEEAAKLKAMPLAERRALGLKAMLAGVNKKYGAKSIGLGASLNYKPIPRISSGIFILDYATAGGWARGRVNLIWGDRSATKTTTALRTIGMAQKTCSITGQYIWDREREKQLIISANIPFLLKYVQTFDPKLAAKLVEKADDEKMLQRAIDASLEFFPPITPMVVQFLDVEGSLDFAWARGLGVDTDSLIYSRPDSSEEAAESIEAALGSSGVDLTVLDSLAAMVPQAEGEGEMSDNHMGLAARINSKMFRKVQRVVNKVYKETENQVLPTLLIINQIRQKIGVMFGSNELKPGGLAQEFYGSIEVKFSGNKVNYYDKDTKQLPRASEFNFVVVKNKCGPPKIHGTFEMMLVNDVKEGGCLAGEIVEAKEVIGFAEQVGIYGKSEDEKQFRMYDEVMPKKMDIFTKYVADRQHFATLKRDVVARLVPKQ